MEANMIDPSLVVDGSLPIKDILMAVTLLVAGGYFLLRGKKKEFDSDLITSYPFDAHPDQKVRSGSLTESGFIGKLQSTKTNVAVFHGSQTGTAEEFSARLAKEALKYGMKGTSMDPEECDMSKLNLLPDMIPNSLALFCVATYGEGDPTDNMKDFFDVLESGETNFAGLNYAVFGLGNKTYEHFNSAGKYVDMRLEQLGAKRIIEVGIGDDDANIEEDFTCWKIRLWDAVCDQFECVEKEDTDQRQYELIVHDAGEIPDDKIYKGEVGRLRQTLENQKPPYDAKNPFIAKVTANRNLYKGDRICMHLEIEITGSKIKYETGDHLAIFCRTDQPLIDKLESLLAEDFDTVITLKNLDKESTKAYPFPCPTTYRTALTYYVDINNKPTTYLLKELSAYATNPEQKQMLLTMSSYTDEGKAMYADWVLKAARTVLHVLEDLDSVRPPLDHLLELLPRLQPRFYSISSSPKVSPNSIHVTAVMVDYDTTTGRNVKGVCTDFLLKKQPDVENANLATVLCYVRKSQFRLPAKSETPFIMVGPGTGLAPFRGFIQELDHLRKEGRPLGEAILYYGCRKRSEDYLYQEELEEYEANGTLTNMYVAFSREQTDKVYVTHLLAQNKDQVWDVIGNKNGHLYVCGDARNMAKQVKDIILDVIQEKGGQTRSEAESFFKKMESNKRYAADVWS